jgi:hypothetical protein
VLFLAGEHYDCHPYVVKPDGTGLKKLASRNGYRGVIDYLDVYDFHDGSSDIPGWAPTASPSSTPPRWGATSSCSA